MFINGWETLTRADVGVLGEVVLPVLPYTNYELRSGNDEIVLAAQTGATATEECRFCC